MSNRDIHEVEEPKGGDERAFKAKHKVKVTDHPEGTKLPPITTSKKKRLADPVDTEATYEEVEHIDETLSIAHKLAITKHVKKLWGKGTVSFEKQDGKHFVSHSDGIQKQVHSIDMKKGVPHVTHFMSVDEEVEHLDETIDKAQVERKMRSKYMGGNPKVTFHRGVVKVNAAGKDYHHKITKGQVEDRPFMTVDEEYVSEAKSKKPSPSTDTPDMAKIRKIAGPGRIMHKEPWHPDHVGYKLYTHTDYNSNIPKIRAFKVHQKTGKVTEFKNYKPSFGEETDSTFSIFWRDVNGMDKQKHGLSEEEVTRLASALEAAGSVKIFIDEEKMTDEQMKKREKYVKGMKSKDDDLRKRYGKRWKDVMYAIATKNAMKEEAESLDEIAKSEEEPLHTQLRKRTNANEVSLTFKNGKTHVVSRGHANKALTMLSGMKPADRQHAHAEMSKSHEHFMDALEGKLSKPSKAGISLAGPKMKNEEVESLDETEQNTAADVAYRKHLRAAVAAKERAEAVGKEHPDYKKHMAVFLSHRKKMMGEEVESLDELDRDGMIRRYAKKTADKVASGEDDEEKRAKGRLLAGKKRWGGTGGIPAAKVPAVQREEVESLDELEKTTLASYIKKSADSLGMYAYGAGKSDDEKEKTKNFRTAIKRNRGIKRASDRLAKEDVESLDEVGGQTSQVSPSQPVSRPVVKPPVKKTTSTANTTVTEAGNIIPPKSPKMKSLSGGTNNYKLDKPRAKYYNVPTQKDRSLEDDG